MFCNFWTAWCFRIYSAPPKIWLKNEKSKNKALLNIRHNFVNATDDEQNKMDICTKHKSVVIRKSGKVSKFAVHEKFESIGTAYAV